MKLFNSLEVQQRSLPTSATHNFYIYGAIDELGDYVDMITTLDYATENDIINIYLNTPGGSLNTTISIIHAMMRSPANITTHADGEVASAGTMIFFAGQQYIVYPYSHFMFHDASNGVIGKLNENMKNIYASSQLIEKIAYDLYCPVFSEEEVDDILEGRDYYCSAEEMYDRIRAVNEAEQESEEELVDNEQRVRVIDPKLKSYQQCGVITDVIEDGRVCVRLDSGKIIYINQSKLEVV